MEKIIETIREALITNADERTKASGERYFKETVKIYGCKSAFVTKLAREVYKELPKKDKKSIFELCGELWKSGYLEETGIACLWSYNVRKSYKPDDIEIFEGWIERYISNWAACDTFCNHTVGEFLIMYPDNLHVLEKWAMSGNRWMKRASAVSLIIPARKGLFLNNIFKIADILLKDQDDMVQKGYGWMLKSASQAHQKEVFEYVSRNKSGMPRTSLRYAIEKMPKELKVLAMAK